MRRILSLSLAAGLALLVGTASAENLAEKCKPMKLILAQGPGSASDYVGRAYAKAITDVSGINVVIDYKPGAEALIGVQAFKASPPDGCTLLLVSSSATVINLVLIPNLPYDPFTDFIPLGAPAKTTLVLNLGTSTQFKTAREFIAAARANPGKYSFASSTTTTRLAGELFQSTSGARLLNVPYKTSAAAATALASGEVDAFFIDPSPVRALWQAGRVRPVASTGSTRMTSLPDLPTLKEEGLPDYEVTGWYSSYYPAKTPAETVSAMREVVRKAGRSPGFQEALRSGAMESFELSGDEVSVYARKEVDMWRKVARNAKLTP